MIFVDTAFLVALIDPKDELHSRATAWSRIVGERQIVTEYVLVETANFLSDPGFRPRLHSIIQVIQSRESFLFLSASPDLLRKGIQLHRDRPDKYWSLTDCISFLVMREHGVTRALTYDHHFEQAGFAALLRDDPPSP